MNDLKGILDKVADRLKSSRVWGVIGSNLAAAFADLPPWPKAMVLAVTVAAYVASETALYWKGIKK